MTAVWLKWLPAGIVPAVIAGVSLIVPFQAVASTDLPEKTPEQVVTMAADSSVHAFSGTLEQTSNLGLPELPNIGGLSGGTAHSESPSAGPDSSSSSVSDSSDISSMLELLTGSHTARIYIDGADNARVQVMDSMAERDLIRHGKDVWLYDSADNTATQLTLPKHKATTDGSKNDTKKDVAPTPGAHTPADLAHQLLATLEPTTNVTLGDNRTVAGRSAYDLQLTPRASDTLIGQISIAVDSDTGLPLSVEIQAKGDDTPAFQLAFTALKLQTPDASLFTFTPPKDATVKKHTLTAPALPGAMTDAAKPDTSHPKPTVIGTGWDAIVEMPAGAVPSQMSASPLLAQATQEVEGGQLLSITLVNVLFTNDGRVLAGSVSLDRLQDAAAGR